MAPMLTVKRRPTGFLSKVVSYRESGYFEMTYCNSDVLLGIP